jgi:hypothetical protein
MAAANNLSVIPEVLHALKMDLQSLSFGRLWINYETCIEDLERAKWRLKDVMFPPNPIPLTPEEEAETKAEIERHKQYLQVYREVLIEKGWDGINKPSDDELPKCKWCGCVLSFRDTTACDECRYEMWKLK